MLSEQINKYVADELNIKEKQVIAAVELLDNGNTVPFIARYRKEATEELTEEQLHLLLEKITYFRNLIKRQEEIKNSIEEQGKMTPILFKSIEKAVKLQELEDIYLPYKQKKKTKASIARDKGLEDLALLILKQDPSIDPKIIAKDFINPEKEVDTVEDAIKGAQDIIAEVETEKADLRIFFRDIFWQEGILEITRDAKKDQDEAFLMYDDYKEAVKTIPSHRILAINRGEKLGAIKVKLDLDNDKNLSLFFNRIIKEDTPSSEIIKMALIDGYKRLLFPSLERELRTKLTTFADEKAIKVFGSNLKQLLLQPPLSGHIVMGLDPGYRTGCKVAIIDSTGNILDHSVFYLTNSDKEKEKAKKNALSLIEKYNVDLVSIGNGTASFETEEFIANLIKEYNLKINYLITNEAGASVYSASKLAVEELPQYDVTVRGAVSIARRIQDPLAELVKIDPKAIGVGQYQHDVNQKELSQTLDIVVESAVNHVGVELNTASPALLKYVSGINSTVAKNIVEYRNKNGRFKDRQSLLKVPRLGQAAFTQSAGFLRIKDGDMPLDNTPVHPESYKLTENLLNKIGFKIDDLNDQVKFSLLKNKLNHLDLDKLSLELNAGKPTIIDIIDALKKPGRDPRLDLPKPLTRKTLVTLEDIKVGSIMQGTVRNIIDFGVFVDIGLKTAGLIHISQLSSSYIKHPLDVVSIGQIVKVKVISVDVKRKRIGLSLKDAKEEN